MTHPIVQLVNAKSLAEGLKELQADNSTEATNTINIIYRLVATFSGQGADAFFRELNIFRGAGAVISNFWIRFHSFGAEIKFFFLISLESI